MLHRTVCRITPFLLVCSTFLNSATAASLTKNTNSTSRFLPYVEMAPFEVAGEQLAVSIHARTRSDRKYARKFAEEVIGIAFQTMNTTTGHGLVIVGRKGEPHPVFVYRKFMAMAGAGQLNPQVAELQRNLTHIMQEWEEGVDFGDGGKDEPDIDFEMVVEAIPLPLEGIGSKLYQWAWAEGFDVEKVEYKFHDLRTADFESDELAQFDWVFYLPPKSAFSEVLKDIVPTMMEHADLGFLQRTAVRSALFVFKPLIKRAVEGARKGMLFMTVLRAMSDYSQDDIEALTEAYIEASMPFGGDNHYDTPLDAILAQKTENAEYAKDPFVAPEPLGTPDLANFTQFEADFSDTEGKTTHRFRIRDDTCTWQYLDHEPMLFYPAGTHTLVRQDGKMTIEFLFDESGGIYGVEERWKRRRKSVERVPRNR